MAYENIFYEYVGEKTIDYEREDGVGKGYTNCGAC